MARSSSRKQEILEALARELESQPGSRITTARLAASLGVSEAALYRHFPSKARMFEALIEFAEKGVFGSINRILEEGRETRQRCARVFYLMLAFTERNPGIVRVLLGDALVGEQPRLHDRIDNFFGRVETQFRQLLRESRLRQDAELRTSPEEAAGLLVAQVEGRMHQWLRSRFTRSPLADWEVQWALLEQALFN